MTSSPLRQFFPALAAVLLLGLFLYKMTEAPPAQPAAPQRAATEGTADIPTIMTVRCAHRPESISISHGGRILWKSEAPELHEEVECGMPLEQNAITLTVSARWPEGTPDTPVTLELEPEGRQAVSATRWSFGPALNDTYSFSWK